MNDGTSRNHDFHKHPQQVVSSGLSIGKRLPKTTGGWGVLPFSIRNRFPPVEAHTSAPEGFGRPKRTLSQCTAETEENGHLPSVTVLRNSKSQHVTAIPGGLARGDEVLKLQEISKELAELRRERLRPKVLGSVLWGFEGGGWRGRMWVC